MSEKIEFNNRLKKLQTSKYIIRVMSGRINDFLLSENLSDIDDRLKELESRVLKTERKTITHRAQQMLILHHLGVLEKLNDLDISGIKKSKLLSALLNASQENIKDDLSAINKKESYLKNTANYKVVNKIFKDAGLKKLVDETDKILDNLAKQEK